MFSSPNFPNFVRKSTMVLCLFALVMMTLANTAFSSRASRQANSSNLKLDLPDLDGRYIARLPPYPWNEEQPWPTVGEEVTFEGYIANFGSAATGPFVYAWSLDGVEQGQVSHPGLAAEVVDVVTFSWNWADSPHTIKLLLDTTEVVSEVSEQNNMVEDRTNGLILGIWVEQSFYEFFNENIHLSGWGGNSFDDWIQRHVMIWNEMFETAIFPIISPDGIIDRVRLDKVVVVPDGVLDCNTNQPAVDYEVDLMWGFVSEQVGVSSSANCSWFTPRYRDDESTWERDMALLHELSHARYLIDIYGFNMDSHERQLAADISATAQTLPLNDIPNIIEFTPPTYLIINGEIIYCSGQSGNLFTDCKRGAQGTQARTHETGSIVFGDQIRIQDGQGNALAGSAALPAVNGAFHRGIDFGFDLMNAGEEYGEHSAYAWNRIAGQRPICGNSNAPCNIGEYLDDLPQENLIELRDTDDNPIANATIEVYRAKPYPIWYGKKYEGAPDMALQTDAQGQANLGASPFGSSGIIHTYGHSNGVLALKITTEDKVGVEFLEVTAFNIAYGRGEQEQAIYPVIFSHWITVDTTPTTPTSTITPASSSTPTATSSSSTSTAIPASSSTPTATKTLTPIPDGWQPLPSGTNNWLWPIQFNDVNSGWVGGEDGLLLKTTDGGATWQTLSTSGPTIQDFYFVDAQYGWRVGSGYVGRSTDGGQSWQQQDYGATHNLLGVHFIDRQRGWIVGGEGGWIRRTVNGGQSWSAVQMPAPSVYLQNMQFVDANQGWAIGWDGTILHSTDGGASWQRQESGTDEILEGLFFWDAQIGWIVGHGGVILHTVNGGISWEQYNSGTSETLFDVAFSSQSQGWAIGENGIILKTSNGGLTWQQQTTGVETTLQKISLLDDEHVWVAGEGGVILKRVAKSGSGSTSLFLPLIIK